MWHLRGGWAVGAAGILFALAAPAPAEEPPAAGRETPSPAVERRGIALGGTLVGGLVAFHSGVGKASPPLTGRLGLRVGYVVGRLTVGVELSAWLFPIDIYVVCPPSTVRTLGTAAAALLQVEGRVLERGWIRAGMGPALAYVAPNGVDDVARYGRYAIDLHGTSWGGAAVVAGGVDVARWEHLTLTVELDVAGLVANPPATSGFAWGTAVLEVEAGLGLRWDRTRPVAIERASAQLAQPPPPSAQLPLAPTYPSRAVTSNAVVAGLFLLLAAANTAVIPVAVLYGLGEPFGIVGPIAIPLAAVGAVAFTVAGALFIREANRVRRARRVGQLMDRMALAF